VRHPLVFIAGNVHCGSRQGDVARTHHAQLTMERRMSTISSNHAHVYYDAPTTREQARQLCEAAGKRFPLTVGRMHDNPVGPHPRGSCQLAFAPDKLAEVLPWLVLNRNGLTVFAHAETGNAIKDHTAHVIWLGPSETLDLSKLD
jgi:aromatic ring-cleaving dioxygenase